jgi:hypothetical protein
MRCFRTVQYLNTQNAAKVELTASNGSRTLWIELYRGQQNRVQNTPLYEIYKGEWRIVAERRRKKTKDVLEMLSEFFREAAVLLLIFYPLEIAGKGNQNLPLPFVLLVGIGCVVLLLIGIVFEKLRGE